MTTPPVRAQLRIVLVEDHATFADSLELALGMDGHETHTISPDGVASLQTLASRVQQLEPDIVLLDLDLGSLGNGVRLITPLVHSHIRVVVVTSTTDRARWGECLALGALRVLSKSAPLGEIRSTIHAISIGAPVMDQQERNALIAQAHQEHTDQLEIRARLEELSPRESVVLGMLMQGETVREIAASSFVAEGTIRTQVKAILAKLQVSSQIAAVGLANRVNWRPPQSD